MSDLEEWAFGVSVALLVAGFVYASVADLKAREVTDLLWQVLGVAALLLGTLVVAPGGVVPVLAWLLVGLLVLQHMFAWDTRLGTFGERYANLLELALYVAVIAVTAFLGARYGLGSTGVPYAVVVVLFTVIFARGLFELGVLFGGADAKALMIAGFLVPLVTSPLYVPAASVAELNSFLPFSVSLLMNAALASIVVPIGLAARNIRRHEFSFRRGFTGYSLPVADLPRRFVWIRDPAVEARSRGEEAIETSEEDQHHRETVAQELRAKGIARVWVSPQIPFLVFLTAGAILALLAGNLVVDLLAVL